LIVLAFLVWLGFAVASVRGERARSAHQLVRDFQCIHRYEGAWNNAGSPYYGGLQMDLAFQRRYGSDYLRAFGTADNWPPSLQIAVAIRAYLSGRGFGPWPATARLCGLS
jgi:hypothetical protein